MAATHDWSSSVDFEHLREVRAHPDRYAPGGVAHLVLEVVAYAIDEAREGTTSRVEVTLHGDGSVSVEDDGRGTQIRFDDAGAPTVKPIMSTRDLRFFDADDAPDLPDGHRRRGISVVAALSEWATHTNRREGRGWSQRYERGIPTGPLEEVPAGTSGTAIRFLPDGVLEPANARALAAFCAPYERSVRIVIGSRARPGSSS